MHPGHPKSVCPAPPHPGDFAFAQGFAGGHFGNHQQDRFDSTATAVATLPAEAFALRRGVCQDFAQIMICGLRALGIPAAYVAGFLRTLPPQGKPRLAGADAMHAWTRAWTGSEAGWVEYDPTNACFTDTNHIVVGYGRDYCDVAPVTGRLRLDGSQKGSHAVDLFEIDEPRLHAT